MTSCCCWFRQPARKISSSRNESKVGAWCQRNTPVACRDTPKPAVSEFAILLRFQKHPVFGHFATRVLAGARGSKPLFRTKSPSRAVLYPCIQPGCTPGTSRAVKNIFPTFLTFSLLDVPYYSRTLSQVFCIYPLAPFYLPEQSAVEIIPGEVLPLRAGRICFSRNLSSSDRRNRSRPAIFLDSIFL